MWRSLAAAAIVAASGAAIYAERATMRSGLHSLSRANPGWIVAGIALETLSMAAFALLQRRLLATAGVKLTLTTLLASTYKSNALSVGVPVVGAGIAAASSVRQYRRRGIDPASVTVALAIAGVISTITFAAVVAAGAIVSGNPAGAAVGLFTGTASVSVSHSDHPRTAFRARKDAPRTTTRLRHPPPTKVHPPPKQRPHCFSAALCRQSTLL